MNKFTPKDYLFILLCALLCEVCLALGIRYFYQAFPEASIEFLITRDESDPIAKEFVKNRGIAEELQ